MSDDKPGALFSREALASWSRICRQEVLSTLEKRDSYYYAFDRHVSAAAGPNGLPYELLMQLQDPPLRAYATKASVVHTLTHISLPAPLASVVHGCVGIESSYHQRAMFAHLYADTFVDGGILQITERATPEDPFNFVGVTYMAVKTPVIKARKYIMFEHSGSVEDANGELVVFKVARSIPSDGVPLDELTPRSAQLALGETYVTFLMRGSHGGVRTDVAVQGMLNQGSSMPGWAAAKLAQTFIEGMARIGTVGASRALGDRLGDVLRESPKLLTKPKTASASSRTAPACRVCLRKKRRLAPTRVCVSCEREVCKSCTQRLHFVAADKPEAVKLRFCRYCVDEALSAGGHLDAASTSSGSSASGHNNDTDEAQARES